MDSIVSDMEMSIEWLERRLAELAEEIKQMDCLIEAGDGPTSAYEARRAALRAQRELAESEFQSLHAEP
jgi:cob(I)alamin adenosyltransferase